MRKALGMINHTHVWYVLDDNESNITFDDVVEMSIVIYSRGLPISLMFDCYDYVYFEGNELGGHLADKLVDAFTLARDTMVDIQSL